MSIGKLLAVFVLVAVGRTNACKGQRCLDHPMNDRYQRLWSPEDDDGVSYRIADTPFVLRDEDNAYRRKLYFPGDTGRRTGKVGAGFTLFGIPIEAEIAFEKNPKKKLSRTGADAYGQDNKEQTDGERDIVRIPNEQRIVFTKQQMHTIKREQMPRRSAAWIPYEDYRRKGGEVSAGIELFGIPLGGTNFRWEKNDEDEKDSNTDICYRRGNEHKVETNSINT